MHSASLHSWTWFLNSWLIPKNTPPGLADINTWQTTTGSFSYFLQILRLLGFLNKVQHWNGISYFEYWTKFNRSERLQTTTTLDYIWSVNFWIWKIGRLLLLPLRSSAYLFANYPTRTTAITDFTLWMPII